MATTAEKLEAHGIEEICDRIAECAALHVIASDCGVSKGSLINWLAGYPDQYARAKEAQAERFAEEILAIADEEATTIRAGKHGDPDAEGDVEVVFDAVAVARNRLRVDARKWLASKMAPKKYGDKLQTEVTGPNGSDLLAPLVAAADSLRGKLRQPTK